MTTSTLDAGRLEQTLSPLLDQITPDRPYRLVGTAAALAQGVQLPTSDIDVLVSRRDDVDAFAAVLSPFPCRTPPTWLPEARQYFAVFTIAGIDLEVSTVEWPADTDTFECAGPGPWRHYTEVDLGRHTVPAVALELRLATELLRDRPDRWRPLIDHMRHHGGDQSLALRAMQDRNVDPLTQQKALDHWHSTPE